MPGSIGREAASQGPPPVDDRQPFDLQVGMEMIYDSADVAEQATFAGSPLAVAVAPIVDRDNLKTRSVKLLKDPIVVAEIPAVSMEIDHAGLGSFRKEMPETQFNAIFGADEALLERDAEIQGRPGNFGSRTEDKERLCLGDYPKENQGSPNAH